MTPEHEREALIACKMETERDALRTSRDEWAEKHAEATDQLDAALADVARLHTECNDWKRRFEKEIGERHKWRSRMGLKVESDIWAENTQLRAERDLLAGEVERIAALLQDSTNACITHSRTAAVAAILAARKEKRNDQS